MASTIDLPARSARHPAAGTTSPAVGRSAARRWLAAALLALGALAVSLLLREYITGTVFVFFFFAIALTAWYSGLRPGLAVTAFGLLSIDYYLLQPYNQFTFGIDVLITLAPLGATAAFISYLTDSLHRSRTRAAAQAERAETASRAKTDFLTIMSHELRTPLNAIVGYVDLLHAEVSGPLTTAQKAQLGRIRSSSMHLLDLIQDVLSFSRIEAGRESPELAETNVAEVVRETAAYVGAQAGDKPLQQNVELPAEPVIMVTDRLKLRHILVNLFGNACKFTERGAVGIYVHCEGDNVVFRITDTGPGIAPEHQELIFEAFRQVDQSRTRLKDGAGLGLAVSRRLAHLLGGDLQVSSAPGNGATFTLRLPVHGV
jgi:signal transduction histidine kinase